MTNKPLSKVGALIIDMDGVLWHGENPLPGLDEFFATIRKKQIPFILATNNVSYSPDQYVEKFARMGVTVSASEILTSGMATATYLAIHNDPSSTRIFVIGENGAVQPLLEQGFILTDLYEIRDTQQPGTGADIVVCGKDTSLNWDKLATATLNIRAGAQFIGTNADTTLPTEHGLTHGNGAILAALEAASEIKPTIIGKPEPIMYQQALTKLGIAPEYTIAIGDRLETDILGAVRTGIRSLMVLTGVSNQQHIEAADYAPDWVMQDIREITAALILLN